MRAWINSYTPEEIKKANLARGRLRRIFASRSRGLPFQTQRIDDDRLPKRPVSAWVTFLTEKYASGAYNGTKVSESSKSIANEWKAMTAAEKQVGVLSASSVHSADMIPEIPK